MPAMIWGAFPSSIVSHSYLNHIQSHPNHHAIITPAGPEDLRCSPCYFNLGKVFLAQGERVNALACNAKVLAIWLCTLCNVVLGELPSTCKIENPAGEVSLNKAQLREARGSLSAALNARSSSCSHIRTLALRCRTTGEALC